MGSRRAAGQASTARSRLRGVAIAERAWIWSVVGYTVLRFVIAWGAFSDHGANVWIFGLLDVGTAWPYAKAVAAICRRAASSQWRRLAGPLALALVSFFVPYAYLWFAAGEMPAGLRVGLVICVAILAAAATLGVGSRTRKLRAIARRHSVADPVVIDLTSEPAVVIVPRPDGEEPTDSVRAVDAPAAPKPRR